MERDQVMGLEWSYEVGADHLGSGAYIRTDASGKGLVFRADRGPVHHVVYLDEYAVKALVRYIEKHLPAAHEEIRKRVQAEGPTAAQEQRMIQEMYRERSDG